MLAIHAANAALSGASEASFKSNLGYSGEQWDASLRMQNLRARAYDPANGRFIGLDPFAGNMQDPQSLHKYAYVHGDPIQGTDPTGMFLGGAISIGFGFSFGGLVGGLGPSLPGANPLQDWRKHSIAGRFGRSTNVTTSIRGFGGYREQALIQAVSDAATIAWAAFDHFVANPNDLIARKFFGDPHQTGPVGTWVGDPVRFDHQHKIELDLYRIALGFDEFTINIQPGRNLLTGGAIAYAYNLTHIGIPFLNYPFTDPSIHINEGFWELSRLERAAIILHELTHEVNQTKDYSYVIYDGGLSGFPVVPYYKDGSPGPEFGINSSLGTGFIHAETAVHNASTFEYYYKKVITSNTLLRSQFNT